MAITMAEDPSGCLRFNWTVQDTTREQAHFSFRMKPNVLLDLITIGELSTLAVNLLTAVDPALNGQTAKIQVEIAFIPSGNHPASAATFTSIDDKLRQSFLHADGDVSAISLPTPVVTDFQADQETPDFTNAVYTAAIAAITGPTTDGTNSWSLVNEDGSVWNNNLNGYRTKKPDKKRNKAL